MRSLSELNDWAQQAPVYPFKDEMAESHADPSAGNEQRAT